MHVAREKKSANASIAGRVIFDNQPLSGVTVTLEFPLNRQEQKDSTFPRPFTAKTDANGNYRITGIPEGYYLVWPRTMAYVMPIEAVSGRAGKTVTVSDGEVVEGVDFNLVRGGVITGKVTDYLGNPVIAQRIRIQRYSPEGKNVPFLSPLTNTAMFETDDRGVYRLFGLEAGRYIVSMGDDAWGRSEKAYARIFYPGVRNEREAEAVLVTTGNETTKIDIKLPKPEKLYEARGRLLDLSTRKSLAGMELAYRLLRDDPNQAFGQSIRNESTDTQGEFLLQNLLSGRYAITVKPDINNEYYSEPVNFEISNGDMQGVEIKAARGATVSGFAVFEGANDSATPKNLAGVRVQASRIEMQFPQFPAQINSSMVNQDGSFRLTGVRPGSNTISVVGTGMRLARLEREGKNIGERIQLATGEDVSGIKVVITMHSTGSVIGQVTIINGALRPDVLLSVFMKRPEDVSLFRIPPAPVDTLGKFTLRELTPGEYEIWLVSFVRLGMPGVKLRLPGAQKVTVGSGETRVTFTVDLGEK